jgi:hypothetical protein
MGVTPPVALRLAEYDVDTIPPVNGPPVIVSGPGRLFTTRVKFPENDFPAESIAWTEKVKEPVAVGIPLNTPELETDNPAGRPEAVKLYGDTPPEALMLWE